MKELLKSLNKPLKEFVVLKFRKQDDETKLIEIMSDVCEKTEDPDCELYFEIESEYLSDVFEEVRKLDDGEYIIKYNIISGYSVRDVGQEYYVDYDLIEIKKVK